MSKSLRPPNRRGVSPRRTRKPIVQAFSAQSIPLSGCWNCDDFPQVQIREADGQLTTVVCPVCRPATSRQAVAR